MKDFLIPPSQTQPTLSQKTAFPILKNSFSAKSGNVALTDGMQTNDILDRQSQDYQLFQYHKKRHPHSQDAVACICFLGRAFRGISKIVIAPLRLPRQILNPFPA